MGTSYIEEVISEAEWANETWSKAYSPAGKAQAAPQHTRYSNPALGWKKDPPKKSRVSFDDFECTKHTVPKYTETRNSTLFITRDEIARNVAESDRECGTFLQKKDAERWKNCIRALEEYNQWLLDSNATKIARGKYKGRLGLVETICKSMVRVKLNGTGKVVCIARSSIEEGYIGSLEDKMYQRSIDDHVHSRSTMEDYDKDDDSPVVSPTADARIRRSKRIASRNEWNQWGD